MKNAIFRIIIAVAALVPALTAAAADNDVAVWITIGQSNADGSAFADPRIDSAMSRWYEANAVSGTAPMKIWYRSTQVVAVDSNALGEAARWVRDGDVTDAPAGWMDLWYRNENSRNRTAMNMIHDYGTYSTGPGERSAQNRRGMEGEFGRVFHEAFPDTELYVIKLGVSGSQISTWANEADDTNWRYFMDKMYGPAMQSILAQGKKPRLAGIWWMQGCADAHCTKEYYEQSLRRLIGRCRTELGFPEAKFYIGYIVKPGETSLTPSGSAAYGEGVRQAQDAVAATTEGVEIIDTRRCTLQHEPGLGGYVHFDHAGINAIGRILARRAIAGGINSWAPYVAP